MFWGEAKKKTSNKGTGMCIGIRNMKWDGYWVDQVNIDGWPGRVELELRRSKELIVSGHVCILKLMMLASQKV